MGDDELVGFGIGGDGRTQALAVRVKGVLGWRDGVSESEIKSCE